MLGSQIDANKSDRRKTLSGYNNSFWRSRSMDGAGSHCQSTLEESIVVPTWTFLRESRTVRWLSLQRRPKNNTGMNGHLFLQLLQKITIVRTQWRTDGIRNMEFTKRSTGIPSKIVIRLNAINLQLVNGER